MIALLCGLFVGFIGTAFTLNSITIEPVPKLIDCALTRTVLEQALGNI
jgi:flagellar biosynthesis protein FliQ